MSDTPISPLRARMIEDMIVRKFGEKTQKDYIRHVKTFSTFLGCSPATATGEDLRRYQVHQSKEGIPPATMNGSVAALRFFFRVTLNHPELGRHLTLVPLPERLRVVLSQEEVTRLLEAAPGVKYKAAFSVAYGAGLRVSEVANLKVSDIESKRMLLRIEQGKGKKDRHAMLSPRRLPSLDWVPVSPVPQRHEHYEGATTPTRRITGHLFVSLPVPTRSLPASCSPMPALPGEMTVPPVLPLPSRAKASA